MEVWERGDARGPGGGGLMGEWEERGFSEVLFGSFHVGEIHVRSEYLEFCLLAGFYTVIFRDRTSQIMVLKTLGCILELFAKSEGSGTGDSVVPVSPALPAQLRQRWWLPDIFFEGMWEEWRMWEHLVSGFRKL